MEKRASSGGERLENHREEQVQRITMAAELPESRTRFTRTISLTAGEPVVYFENRAENLTALDRPVGWCEHVTVGPPFLKKGVTLFDASLTRGRNLGDTFGRRASTGRLGRLRPSLTCERCVTLSNPAL